MGERNERDKEGIWEEMRDSMRSPIVVCSLESLVPPPKIGESIVTGVARKRKEKNMSQLRVLVSPVSVLHNDSGASD